MAFPPSETLIQSGRIGGGGTITNHDDLHVLGNLTVDGSFTPTGPLYIADGTVAAPGLAYASEHGTGFYYGGAGDARFAVLGVRRLTMTATTLLYAGNIQGNILIGATDDAVAGITVTVASSHSNTGVPVNGIGAGFQCQAESLAGVDVPAAQFVGVHTSVTAGVEFSEARVRCGMAGVIDTCAVFTRPTGTIANAMDIRSAIANGACIMRAVGSDTDIEVRIQSQGSDPVSLSPGGTLNGVRTDLNAGAVRIAFYDGVTPVVRAGAISAPTAPGAIYAQAEAASAVAAINSIRTALLNIGITA